VNHLPNPNIHIHQLDWLQQRPPFPYAVIAASVRRQQQVVVAPLLPPDDEPRVLLPPLLVPIILEIGDPTREGVLVRAVGFGWLEIAGAMLRDPQIMYGVEPYVLEQLVAGGWKRAGADKVILTPRSGDGGVDVYATFAKAGRIRLADQVKRYAPDHRVTLEEVLAMIGVLHVRKNVSKVLITTTSEFAPGIAKDVELQRYVVTQQLELRDRSILLPWIEELAKGLP